MTDSTKYDSAVCSLMQHYEYGTTEYGTKVHIVDFDTDSMLAKGNNNPDKARCGLTGAFSTCNQPPLAGLCQSCIDRYGIPTEYKE